MYHCGTQVIETKRLLLRPFQMTDAADLLELWIADPAVQSEYGEPVYETPDPVEGLLNKWIAGYASPAFYRWAMIERESGRCIGQIAFCRVKASHDGRAVEIDAHQFISQNIPCFFRKFVQQGLIMFHAAHILSP